MKDNGLGKTHVNIFATLKEIIKRLNCAKESDKNQKRSRQWFFDVRQFLLLMEQYFYFFSFDFNCIDKKINLMSRL